MVYDIRWINYDQWENSTFNNEVISNKAIFNPFDKVDRQGLYLMDAATIINYCTCLFMRSDSLLSKYTPGQLEQGLWFVGGPQGYLCKIENFSASTPSLMQCIYSMYFMYRNIFTLNTLGAVCNMWWDFDFMIYVRKNEVLTKAAILTMKKILSELDSIDCVYAAIHGLGHIEGPMRKEVIDILTNFVHSKNIHDEDLIKYVQSACRGDVW